MIVRSAGVDPSSLAYHLYQQRQPSTYKEDVFGRTPDEAKTVVHNIGAFVSKFVSLPDNVLVRFDAAPDEVCRACVLGQHCRTLMPGDIQMVRAMARLARKYSLEGDNPPESGKAHINLSPDPQPYVEMSAGLARRVLGMTGLMAKTRPWYMRWYILPFACFDDLLLARAARRSTTQ